VPVYVTAFAGTQRAYPRRDGQAELTRVYLLVITGLDGGCWRVKGKEVGSYQQFSHSTIYHLNTNSRNTEKLRISK